MSLFIRMCTPQGTAGMLLMLLVLCRRLQRLYDSLEALVLLEDEVHLQPELFVVCGQLFDVPSQFFVVILQAGVLVKNDLLSLDPHVPRPLGGLVVFQPSRPVPLVLVLVRNRGLFPPTLVGRRFGVSGRRRGQRRGPVLDAEIDGHVAFSRAAVA